MRRLRGRHHGPVPAAGRQQVLARGVSALRRLCLPTGRGRHVALREGGPHTLPQGLPQVSEAGGTSTENTFKERLERIAVSETSVRSNIMPRVLGTPGSFR